MQALFVRKIGSPDYLELREIAKPRPNANDVLVKVQAVSINDWDSAMLQDNFMTRLGLLFGGGSKVIGCDIAGYVESVGENVKRFKPGDAVFGDLSRYFGGFGGFAEYVRAPEASLAPKPATMSFEQAAAIPQAGVLMVQALAAGGPLKDGQKILINGAGGGCGTIGIQILKQHAVEVTGVDNTGKLELMRSLGFDHVIDYTKEDFTRNGELYDLIVDTKTTRAPSHIARSLAPGGTYATVGGNTRLAPFALLKPWLRRKYGKNFGLVMLKPNSELPYLCKLFEAGMFKPVIDRPYKFTDSDVRAAFHRFSAGEHQGKIVVTVAEDRAR